MKLLAPPLLAVTFLTTSPQLVWGQTVIPVDVNVMTSGFFQGANVVRGYPADDRPAHRVSSNEPFDTVGAETVYFTFDYDFAALGGPVPQAIFRVESIAGGFNADGSPENPFLMSVHGVTADPIASITDDTNPAGPVDWVTFFNDYILDAPAAARTSVTGIGTIEFDVTEVVNSWIAGTNSVHALALTGKYDVSGVDFLHGIVNDMETDGVTHSLTLVPEPTGWFLGLLGSLAILLIQRGKRT